MAGQLVVRQEDQLNGGQPEQFFDLNHLQRGELMTGMTQLSTILQYSRPIPDKNATIRWIDNQINWLFGLAPFKSHQYASDAIVFEKLLSGQLSIGLTEADRSRVMNHLIAVRNAVIFERLTTCDKRKLAIENKLVIDRLLNLPVREQSHMFSPELANDANASRESSLSSQSSEPPLKKPKGKRIIHPLSYQLDNIKCQMLNALKFVLLFPSKLNSKLLV